MIQMDFLLLHTFLPQDTCLISFTTVFGKLELNIGYRNQVRPFDSITSDGLEKWIQDVYENKIQSPNLFNQCQVMFLEVKPKFNPKFNDSKKYIFGCFLLLFIIIIFLTLN